MARYTGATCRLCRREGMKLFLKGDRCFTDKCAFVRRSYAPGQHGASKKKISNYGTQLREMRLDNVVFRLGFGASRTEARQLVTHGHFLVNGKKVDIPSYRVSVNDVITVCEKSRGTEKFKTFAENPKALPKWLTANVENFEGKVIAEPVREDIDVPVNETLIVELYSK